MKKKKQHAALGSLAEVMVAIARFVVARGYLRRFQLCQNPHGNDDPHSYAVHASVGFRASPIGKPWLEPLSADTRCTVEEVAL